MIHKQVYATSKPTHEVEAGRTELVTEPRAASVVTDKTPPGWLGPDSDKTVDQWIKDLDK